MKNIDSINKGKKRGAFWTAYAIATASALLVIAVGLAIFYRFIASYEATRPIHTAEAFAEAQGAEGWEALIAGAAEGYTSPYETSAAIRAACLARAGTLDVTVVKSGEGTASKPVFFLMNGDVRIGRVALADDGTNGFGFRQWRVADAVVYPEALAERSRVVILAPAGAVVTLNGITLGGDVRDAGRAAYRYASPYDGETAKTFCEVYEVGGLFTEPTVACTLRGVECPRAEGEIPDGEFDFLVPPRLTTSAVVTAPAGSVVTLNGVPLAADVAAESVPYDVLPFEAGADGLPRASRYVIGGLLAPPAVAATLDGRTLSVDQTADGGYRAEYPRERLYSARILAPAGATVTLRGVDCAPYKTETREADYASLYDDPTSAPVHEEYWIGGLYLPPDEPVVKWNGVVLTLSAETNSSVTVYDAAYPPASEAETADIVSLAQKFTDAYLTYTSYGYRDTEANLAAVLKFVQSGSTLERRLRRSLDSFSYTTPVQYTRRSITPEQPVALGDGVFVCRVSYDVAQYFSTVNRSFTGALTLRVTLARSGYVVSAMAIDAE